MPLSVIDHKDTLPPLTLLMWDPHSFKIYKGYSYMSFSTSPMLAKSLMFMVYVIFDDLLPTFTYLAISIFPEVAHSEK